MNLTLRTIGALGWCAGIFCISVFTRGQMQTWRSSEAEKPRGDESGYVSANPPAWIDGFSGEFEAISENRSAPRVLDADLEASSVGHVRIAGPLAGTGVDIEMVSGEPSDVGESPEIELPPWLEEGHASSVVPRRSTGRPRASESNTGYFESDSDEAARHSTIGPLGQESPAPLAPGPDADDGTRQNRMSAGIEALRSRERPVAPKPAVTNRAVVAPVVEPPVAARPAPTPVESATPETPPDDSARNAVANEREAARIARIEAGIAALREEAAQRIVIEAKRPSPRATGPKSLVPPKSPVPRPVPAPAENSPKLLQVPGSETPAEVTPNPNDGPEPGVSSTLRNLPTPQPTLESEKTQGPSSETEDASPEALAPTESEAPSDSETQAPAQNPERLQSHMKRLQAELAALKTERLEAESREAQRRQAQRVAKPMATQPCAVPTASSRPAAADDEGANVPSRVPASPPRPNVTPRKPVEEIPSRQKTPMRAAQSLAADDEAADANEVDETDEINVDQAQSTLRSAWLARLEQELAAMELEKQQAKAEQLARNATRSTPPAPERVGVRSELPPSTRPSSQRVVRQPQTAPVVGQASAVEPKSQVNQISQLADDVHPPAPSPRLAAEIQKARSRRDADDDNIAPPKSRSEGKAVVPATRPKAAPQATPKSAPKPQASASENPQKSMKRGVLFPNAPWPLNPQSPKTSRVQTPVRTEAPRRTPATTKEPQPAPAEAAAPPAPRVFPAILRTAFESRSKRLWGTDPPETITADSRQPADEPDVNQEVQSSIEPATGSPGLATVPATRKVRAPR